MGALEQEISQPIEVEWSNESYPTSKELVKQLLEDNGFSYYTKGGRGSSNETYIFNNQNTKKKIINK